MRSFLIGLPVLLLLYSCGTEPPSAGVSESMVNPSASSLTNLDLPTLVKVKAAIQSGDKLYLPAYEALLRDADTALADRLYSVTEKTTVPPSGDKHDYLSYGPYWWPDTTKPDGLPWIRRDGEVNPLTRGDNVDILAKNKAFRNTETLALAFFFSDQKKYAQRALAQLTTWFLDPETRMNPNLNFGQGIPGINTGRGIGIIETIALGQAITGMELLKLAEQLPSEQETGLNEWLTEFTNWLMTSEMGIAEREWHNNHGSWYDVQVVVLLRHLGREEEALKILETAREKRIASHLAADGSQPHELTRTKSLGYSTMNLRSLTRLAYHGEQLGVDLWNYVPEHGAGLSAAYAFLEPYAFDNKQWPYQQLGSMEETRKKTRRLFYETGALLNINEFCEMRRPEDEKKTDRSLLLHHCPNS